VLAVEGGRSLNKQRWCQNGGKQTLGSSPSTKRFIKNPDFHDFDRREHDDRRGTAEERHAIGWGDREDVSRLDLLGLASRVVVVGGAIQSGFARPNQTLKRHSGSARIAPKSLIGQCEDHPGDALSRSAPRLVGSQFRAFELSLSLSRVSFLAVARANWAENSLQTV